MGYRRVHGELTKLGIAVAPSTVWKILHAVLTEYHHLHYNTARPHQGIAQRVPDDEPGAPHTTVTDVDTQQIRRKPSWAA